MRIWFAADVAPDSCGGVARSMRELASRLKQRGHRVRVIYNAMSGRRSYLSFAALLAFDMLVSFFARPDWIIARSTDGALCALAAHLLRLKTRVALYSHGWEEKAYLVERRLPASIVSNPTTMKGRLVRFPLLRLTLRWSALCICGTAEEARWVSQKHPRHAGKVRLVPNGVEFRIEPYWRSQSELPPSFLMVGAFTWKKNVDYGIELFSAVKEKIPDARLFLVGTGEVPVEEEKRLADLGDSVFNVSFELPEKMSRWYETCPYLISTSRYEGGHSFTILEAQACGVVAFATAIPSSCELIQHGKNGMLLSGCDPVKDTELILSTIADSQTARCIGENAWRTSQRHRWPRQVERLERLLRL